MSAINQTCPSERLQSTLQFVEDDLRKRVFKNDDVPEFYVMTATLITAYEAYDRTGKLDTMFDTSNSYDLAMLVWCVESTLREKRKKEGSQIDPTRN